MQHQQRNLLLGLHWALCWVTGGCGSSEGLLQMCLHDTLLNPQEMPKAEASRQFWKMTSHLDTHWEHSWLARAGLRKVSPYMAPRWYRYLNFFGYNLNICTFHGAVLREVFCPLLHLSEGAGTENAPIRTSSGGFCLVPTVQTGYIGQPNMEAEPLQKVKLAVRKEPWVPWKNKITCFSLWEEPHTHFFQLQPWSLLGQVWKMLEIMRMLEQRNSGKAEEGKYPASWTDVRCQEVKGIFFGPSGLVLEGHNLF